MASNAQVGKFVLVIAVSIFLYYFFWVSILPFMLIDEGNLIHSFFPPLEYAFILPAIFGVVFLGGIAIFSLYHIWAFARTRSVSTTTAAAAPHKEIIDGEQRKNN